jgi:hypothetical protein
MGPATSRARPSRRTASPCAPTPRSSSRSRASGRTGRAVVSSPEHLVRPPRSGVSVSSGPGQVLSAWWAASGGRCRGRCSRLDPRPLEASGGGVGDALGVVSIAPARPQHSQPVSFAHAASLARAVRVPPGPQCRQKRVATPCRVSATDMPPLGESRAASPRPRRGCPVEAGRGAPAPASDPGPRGGLSLPGAIPRRGRGSPRGAQRRARRKPRKPGRAAQAGRMRVASEQNDHG